MTKLENKIVLLEKAVSKACFKTKDWSATRKLTVALSNCLRKIGNTNAFNKRLGELNKIIDDHKEW